MEEIPDSEVMGWVRANMSFAILRVTNLCLHGSKNQVEESDEH